MLPFERRIRRAAAARAAQRRRRNNCFCHVYIEIYMFFPPNLIFVNSIFSANQFLIQILSCAALWKTNATANNIMRRATPQCMWLYLYDCTGIYRIFTVFHKHSTLFTVFLLYFTSILLDLPYFYCISLFQASVALMFTDLNLVLLLYYFIIALSRFLNLKWALCLIKSKLQVNGLRGLPRVTPKVASNSHHCFSLCFLIQGQQLETFWFTRSLWCI